MNIAPNNYLSVNYKSKKETDLINEKLIINNIEEIIDYNNIDKNNLEKEEENKKNKDKNKNNNKICGVFTKEDFDIKIKLNHGLNDSFEKKYYNPLENEKDNENKNKFEINIKGDNNNKIINNDSNISKNNKEKNIEIKKDIINGNNNNNEDDYLIIVDDDNNIKEVKFNNSNEYNYDLIPTNNSQQIDSVINMKITNSNENLNYNISNEENSKIKKENIYCKDNIINIHIPKEKNINLPLSLSFNKENKINKKDENNKFTSNKIMDIDVKEKILELSEKLEKSEKNIKMIKNTNDKLLEIMNNFTNFKISDKDKYINTKENNIKNYFKDLPVKKRYFSPSSNNEKINLKIVDKKDNKKYLNKERLNGNHKKSKSFSKLKVNVDGNYSGKQNNSKKSYYKINGYDLSKGNKYSLIYKKEKNKKVIKSKLYKREKQKDKNKLIRNTIFLTGANNYSKKIKNYDNYPLDSYEAINGNYLYNHSFPSSRSNHNKSEILMTNGIGNIYQREVMKLPPEQQPLFYESSTKFFINNYLYTNNINTTCNDTISFNEQKLNFDEKYNYIKPKNGNNYLNIETNGNKRHKNKLLDFKDFQVIFEEKDDKSVKPDENIININQAYILNNSKINSDSNLEKNKKCYNKICIPSLKSKINSLKNNKNLNINFNNMKENGKITKKESGIKENGIKKYNINKYSDFINQKYNHLFRNQKNDINNNNNILNDNNAKIVNKSQINKSKNEYMIPFYLINIKDLCNNIINTSNTKKK